MDLTETVTLQIVSICVAGVCGWLAATAKSVSKRQEALEAGVCSLLRRELVNDFEKYVEHGDERILTIERKQEIDDCYDAYSRLGGNGTGKAMYDKLQTVRVRAIE